MQIYYGSKSTSRLESWLRISLFVIYYHKKIAGRIASFVPLWQEVDKQIDSSKMTYAVTNNRA